MTRPIDGLVFTVLDCTVTDEAAGESYDILAGQCAGISENKNKR